MGSVFDWLSVALFSGVALLFLSRSARPEGAPDKMIAYLPPAIGCMAANWLGNHNYSIPAGIVLAAVALYVLLNLKPRLG